MILLLLIVGICAMSTVSAADNVTDTFAINVANDAVTTDECKRILEEKDKIYTQIKIDEITNTP